MTEVAFTDASGNVRLRGTLEPPPGGSALTVTDGSTPVADVTEILLVGAQTSDNGGGTVQVDIAPGLTDVLGVSDDAGGHDITNVANVVLDGSGSVNTSGGDVDTDSGNVTTSGGDVQTGTGGVVRTDQVTGEGGHLKIGAAANTLGFFDSVGNNKGNLPVLVTAQDIADLLVTHGFCTQGP